MSESQHERYHNRGHDFISSIRGHACVFRDISYLSVEGNF